MPERVKRRTVEEPWTKPKQGDDDGPQTPDIDRPDSRRLLERMKRVDPRQAQRYRQRSGE
ncbi:MAG: ubiquitin-like protein UBact [Candidatus Bipolaricaulia bacterium]